MAGKSIPERVPLDEFEPSIYDVANGANTDIDVLRTLHAAIICVGAIESQIDRSELLQKVVLMANLAAIGKTLADDAHNDRDCQIAACMLASEDPAVRSEART